MKKVILASGSERRKELLGVLGVGFEVVESGFDESLIEYEGRGREFVEELALQKALKVSSGIEGCGPSIVVGADTVIELEGEIIGKPSDLDEAREILTKLAGKEHRVLTGVCVLDCLSQEREVVSEESWVRFREIGEEEKEKYIESEEWRGKAGGYAIQEAAGKFVVELKGSFSNVVGFPLERVKELLERLGVRVGVEDVRELEYKIRKEGRG